MGVDTSSRSPVRACRGLAVERLERRALMAVDGLGVFARQQGRRDWFAPNVSLGFAVQEGDFHPADSGDVLLRLTGRVGLFERAFADLRVTSAGVVSQARTGDGGLLARVENGHFTVSARFGWDLPNADYTIDYRLAGDVDGSFDVTPADLALIRSGIRRPRSLSRGQFANADVDGNGDIDARDLKLAASNVGAATSVRPLRVRADIGSATPSHEGVVRLPSSQIAATTAAGATVVFVNAATGERVQRPAASDGSATADLTLLPSALNRIDVTAKDTFGQVRVGHVTVHQRPTPVLIVPGWATSMPRSLFDLPDFLMHRGYPAGKLAATGLVYDDLRDSLARGGYVKGRDQFIVPYDWRLPIAPDDGMRDGVLSLVTTEAILRPRPEFSLGYLGNFLKQLVRNDPSIVKVDMLGHSNGGLVTRAYIQSAAYGASFTEAGRTYNLPTVDRVMLLATPSMGSAISWPLWNNDSSSFAVSLVLADLNLVQAVLKPVYAKVVEQGLTVAGPDGAIDRAAIADPLTGRPDPLKFLRLYLASLRDLLPTYAFLRDSSGGLATINDTPSANHLLLDINATSSPGVNPWTANVGSVTVTFGVHPIGMLTQRPVVTETFDRVVVADGKTGSIWPFQLPKPITPPAGTVYHVKESVVAGDDMVPARSLAATYADDPRIVIRPWGNGTPGPGLSWTPTKEGVRHATFLTNRDVLAFIRSRLAAGGGRRVSTAPPGPRW